MTEIKEIFTDDIRIRKLVKQCLQQGTITTDVFDNAVEYIRQTYEIEIGACEERFMTYLDDFGIILEADEEFDLADEEDDIAGEFDNDPIKLYLLDLRKIPLLTAEQESDLARQMHSGDSKKAERARAALIKSNLRYVFYIAKKYHKKNIGLDFVDIIEEGNIGLIFAVDRFDHKKQFRLATYATPWIKQRILRAIDNQSRTVRLPVHQSELVRKVKKAQRRLQAATGRFPSVEEIAAEIGLPQKKVADAIKNMHYFNIVSLDKPLKEGEEGDVGDFILDDDDDLFETVMSHQLKQELFLAMDKLTQRERDIITLRYGLNGQRFTLEEIGNIYRLTRERIRQLESKALKKLSHPSRNKNLIEFL